MGTEALLTRSNHLTEEDFAGIAESHAHELFRLAFRMVGSEHDAEEVVQETLLRAFRKRKQFDGRSKVSTWLYRIASNCAIDFLRTRKRDRLADRDQENTPDQVPSLGRSQELLVHQKELVTRLGKLMQELTPKDRLALVLRHYQDCSIEEISRIMNIKPNAAKQAIFRAVHKLRKGMTQGTP